MFIQLTENTYKNSIENTDSGVIICFKKLCPHCKNMEKVLEKFAKMQPEVSFYSLDSEEDSLATKALGVERVPSILVVKGGNVAAQKAGLMNPKEMKAFYQSA